MPRKPNYKFERHERDRAKAAKKAAKKAARAEDKTDGAEEAPRLDPLNSGHAPESD